MQKFELIFFLSNKVSWDTDSNGGKPKSRIKNQLASLWFFEPDLLPRDILIKSPSPMESI